MNQKIIFTNHVGEAVDDLVAELGTSDVHVICDVNTSEFVMPLLVNNSKVIADAGLITVKSGDTNKNIESLSQIWRTLSQSGATRQSVIINVGGGVITDMGGFAAATFKRGLKFINIPTTLLAAVDASVGGKTGINFNGLKNEIGTFTEPEAAIISTIFFNTLTQQELLSGYAEMLKHALLESRERLAELLNYSVVYPEFDSERLLTLLEQSVGVKQRIVEQDLHEQGLRRALNLGHTVGHAFEAFAMQRQSPIPHGYAVAWGLVCELIISNMQLGFPSDTLHQFAAYVKTNYGAFDITCDDYPTLLQLMSHDKKNADPDKINFSLLRDVGDVVTDCTADPKTITAALDIYRDLMGL